MEKQKNISGTLEWATKNLNCTIGCSNNCKFCYAKAMAIRFHRATSESWKIEKINDKILQLKPKKIDGRLMFPSTHDITPGNVDTFIIILKNWLDAGNDFLIVSKPNFNSIKRICDVCEEYIENITFRFTIGSTDSEVLKFWEPGAPSFNERMNSLEYAFSQGFQTSISIEPFLDSNVEAIIENTRPFVTDSIWIGKMNRIKNNLTMNGHTDETTISAAKELMNLYASDYKYQLYSKYKDDELIRWKDSLKKDFNLPRPTKAGLDI